MNQADLSTRPQPAPELADQLEAFERARQQQLDALPPPGDDVVAAAHRASVERILAEVRTARERLAAGRYGVCLSCADPISDGRLRAYPWAVRCRRCAERARW